MKTLSALKIHISKILAQRRSPLKMPLIMATRYTEMHAELILYTSKVQQCSTVSRSPNV